MLTIDDGKTAYPWGDRTGQADVRWELHGTLRPWGVKDFYIIVPAQSLTQTMTEEENDEGSPELVTYVIEEGTYVKADIFSDDEPLPRLCPEELRREKGQWTLVF